MIVKPKNTFVQTVKGGILFILIIVGAYHVFVDWVMGPILNMLNYLSSVSLENKVLLVIWFLGIHAIWFFRTRKP